MSVNLLAGAISDVDRVWQSNLDDCRRWYAVGKEVI